MVVLFSFHETSGLSFPFRGFSLRWYREVFASEEITETARNSLIVATATAAVPLVLGTLAAYGLGRTSGDGARPLALLFFLPLTLPGLFIGLSLLVFFNLVSDQVLEFKLSLTSVAIAHLVYVIPYFLLIAIAALDRLDIALEEAAPTWAQRRGRCSGGSRCRRSGPCSLGATSLAFALSFDEFIITFFVIGPESTRAHVHLVLPSTDGEPHDQRRLDPLLLATTPADVHGRVHLDAPRRAEAGPGRPMLSEAVGGST